MCSRPHGDDRRGCVGIAYYHKDCTKSQLASSVFFISNIFVAWIDPSSPEATETSDSDTMCRVIPNPLPRMVFIALIIMPLRMFSLSGTILKTQFLHKNLCTRHY